MNTETFHRSFSLNFKIFWLIFFFFTGSAHAASFDCAKAKTKNEKLMCANEIISKLDENLNVQYQKLLKFYVQNQAIRQWQMEWLKSDELKCKDSDCLEKAYKKRILELKSANNAEPDTKGYTGRYIRVINGKTDPNQAQLLIIGLSGRRVFISGTSSWNNLHTGEMAGYGILMGGSVAAKTKELCGANFQLVDEPYLEVQNESGCGGMNVTFNGIYKSL
jgi:hypothetical protein